MTSRFATMIERARSHRPVTWLTLIGVLLLPAVLGGVLVAALQNPTQRLDAMTAAVVNQDEPVTLDGQLVPLGRQLTSGLVEGTGKADENLTWVISNEKDAAKGLADGTYQAVVTIPKDFSASALSGGRAVSDTGVKPQKAQISVTTAPEARVADGLIANQIATTAAATMGTSLAEKTMENVLLGFGTMGDKIGEAATGADKLATGAASAADGAAKIPDGAAQLADGAGKLGSGAASLATGLDALTQGASSAQSGAQQLGAQLTAGADQLRAGAPQAAQAAAGAASVATGAQALAKSCTEYQLPKEYCDQVEQVAIGAQGVSNGVSQLAQMPGQVADQLAQAGDGANQLAGGIGQLTSGAAQSADGARQLATGGYGLQTGAAQLGDGAKTLADGVRTLSSGTASLASGLHQAADALPDRSASETSSLASVIADPVNADAGSGMFGPTAIPLLAAVVLWFGGLASFIAMRAVTARALTSRRSSAGLALRAFAPTAAIGAAQGLLVSLIVQIVAAYDADHWWGFAGVAMLAGVVFAAVNQALVAVLGGAGRWISAVVGVAAVGAGIISTLPGWLAGAASALPTSPAATALLGGDGTGSAIAAMATWGVLALVATTLSVTVRRTTSAKAVLAPAV